MKGEVKVTRGKERDQNRANKGAMKRSERKEEERMVYKGNMRRGW